jgi:hypothetical protein
MANLGVQTYPNLFKEGRIGGFSSRNRVKYGAC